MKALRNLPFRLDEVDIAHALATLAETFPLGAGPVLPGPAVPASGGDFEPTTSRDVRTYWDSFDWRLWRDGQADDDSGALQGPTPVGTLLTRPRTDAPVDALVDTRTDGSAVEWIWRRSSGEELRRTGDGTDVLPGLASDLPTGPFRDQLESVLSMRRLLPHARVTVECGTLRVLDDEGKTVARLRTERGRVEALDPMVVPDENLFRGKTFEGKVVAEADLPPTLRVIEVRGYKDWRRVAEFLSKRLGARPAEQTELEAALDAVDRSPGDYRSKVELKLDPALTAGEATRVVLRDIFDTMLANEEGARLDLDSEFLHDFRVAVRRTRSALSRLRGVVPPAVREHFGAEFKWLGGVTGVVRDLDVHLLKMPDYESDLPETVRQDLGPLNEHLVRRQAEEQALLVKHLRSKRYRELVKSWQAFVDRSPGEYEEEAAGEVPDATRPVKQVASAEIWRIYRKILKRGAKITGESPDDDVHDLRKDCKKLRYLLEFFRSLYPKADMDRSIKALKKLQDVLGDFNDYSVQREALSDMAVEMAEEMQQPSSGRSGVPAGTLLAMGRLVGHFEDWQAEERSHFDDAFAAFTSKRVRKRYRELFKA